MAGDASLGITPVMKWNFERSCYRWLVTRHPAQFERMDFTAQILQSASRARKAFYECGWAEAKVLIRPSDGKFERTPFFDTIIRRGLRNSTRFDASTLTEEEIDALGMHRDETLGFKLQIRHFRSRGKETAPPAHGRVGPSSGGGGTMDTPVTSPVADSRPHPTAIPSPTGSDGGHLRNGDDGGVYNVTPRHTSRPRVIEPWAEDGRSRGSPAGPGPSIVAPAGLENGRWAEDVGWHRDGRGRSMDPVAHGDRWKAWDNARRWNTGHCGRGVEKGAGRQQYAADGQGLSSVSGWSPHTAHSGRAVAVRTSGAGGSWEAHCTPSWGPERGQHGGSWGSLRPGTTGGEGYEAVPTRASTGSHDLNPVAQHVPGGRLPREVDVTAGYRSQVQPSGGRPASRRMVGVSRGDAVSGNGNGNLNGSAKGGTSEALVKGTSHDSSVEAGRDGGLIAQGYQRLAAMKHRNDTGADRSKHLDGGIDASAIGSSRYRSCPPGSHYDAPQSAKLGVKRAGDGGVSQGDVVYRAADGVDYQARSGQSSEGEEGAFKKRRLMDGGEGCRVQDSMQQHDPRSGNQGRSVSSEPREQAWHEGQGGTPPPDVQCDMLARELAESEKHLTSARHVLDAARVRFEDARRAHHTKREQVIAAAGRRAVEAAHTLEECASLHSLARSCAAAAAKDESTGPLDGKNGHKRSDDICAEGIKDEGFEEERGRQSLESPTGRGRPETDHRPFSASSSATSASTDEMREVKLEAALLCGIGRAPVPSPSGGCKQSPSIARTTPPCDGDKGLDIVSLPAASIPAQRLPRTNSPAASVNGAGSSSGVRTPEPRGASWRMCSSPLPNLASAIPGGSVPRGMNGRVEGGSMRRSPSSSSNCGNECKPSPREFTPRAAVEVRKVVGSRGRVGSPVQRGGGGIGMHAGAFPPPALAAHPAHGGMRMHRPITTRGTLPPIAAQMPGSPSGSGETDSDNGSDSTSGTGMSVSSQHHPHQHQRMPQGVKEGSHSGRNESDFGRTSDGSRESWGRRDGNGHGRGDGHIAPLERLAAVATFGRA